MNKLQLLQKKFNTHKRLIIPWLIALGVFLAICVYLIKSVLYAASVIDEMHATVTGFEYPGMTRVSTYQSSRFASTADVSSKYTLGAAGVSPHSLFRYYCGEFSEKIAGHWDKEGTWDSYKFIGRNCKFSGSLDSWSISWCSKPRRVKVSVSFNDVPNSPDNLLRISSTSRLEYFSQSCE